MQILIASLKLTIALVSPVSLVSIPSMTSMPTPSVATNGPVFVRAQSTSPGRSDPVLVRAVLDGDTIDVSAVGRVRLLGIDAPELGRGYDTAAPFGREARDRLAALVLHRWVRLEQDGAASDVYRRRLAYVLLEDGLFVNALLVREGLARVSARTPLRRLGELQRAEAEAQSFRRGMWGTAPQIPSAGYTRRSLRVPSAPRRKAPAAGHKTRRSQHKA
jgi:endonuclease YncB( thermonuclease family)